MKILLLPTVVLIVLVTVVPYVKNIIKLTECDFEPPYKCEAIHSVGLLPPVGIITGWMDFSEDEKEK